MTEIAKIMIHVGWQILFRWSIYKDFHWALFMIIISYFLLKKAFLLSSTVSYLIPYFIERAFDNVMVQSTQNIFSMFLT